jgi:hypothetical protein
LGRHTLSSAEARLGRTRALAAIATSPAASELARRVAAGDRYGRDMRLASKARAVSRRGGAVTSIVTCGGGWVRLDRVEGARHLAVQ